MCFLHRNIEFRKITRHPTLSQSLITLVNNIPHNLQPSPIAKLIDWCKLRYSIVSLLTDEKPCQSQESTWWITSLLVFIIVFLVVFVVPFCVAMIQYQGVIASIEKACLKNACLNLLISLPFLCMPMQ